VIERTKRAFGLVSRSELAEDSTTHGTSLAPRPRDEWDALTSQFRRELTVPPFPTDGRGTQAAIAAATLIVPVPASAKFHFHGPEPVGIPVELPPSMHESEADAALIHLWILLYKQIVQDSGLPVMLSGRWGLLDAQQSSFLVWLNAGPTQLVVVPTLRRYGRTISISIAHSVLCHQGWMRAHDPRRPADWADLCSNYEKYFFTPGNAYYEVMRGWHEHRVYWHHQRTWMDKLLAAFGGRRFGWGDGEVAFTTGEFPGNPIYFCKEFNSFVHFYVGDRAVPHGSQPGVQLKQISTMIASSSRDWKLATNIQEAPRIEPPPRQGLSVHSRELD